MTEEAIITDEMRAVIGKEAEPLTVEVDKTAIRWFARAVGHTDLVYYDEAYAKSKGTSQHNLPARLPWPRHPHP